MNDEHRADTLDRAMRALLLLPLLGVLLAAQAAPAPQAAPELVVSVGHSGAPRRAAFAGRYLVTSQGSNVAFIELSTGITVRRVSQGLLVDAIEPSPAGDLVAISSCDHTISLYDVNTLALVRRITTPQECASSLSFTPDGTLLAAENYACCREKAGLRIWNVRTGNVFRELTGVGSIRHVVFGADRWLAAVDDNGKVTIFEWPSGRVLRTWEGLEHSGYTGSALIASRDGRYVGWNQTGDPPRVWDAASGREIALPVTDRTFAAAATFLDDGRLAYVDDDRMFAMRLPDGPVQTLQLASTAIVNYDVISSDPENWLTIRRDGLMAAGKRQNETLVWDVAASRRRDITSPPLVSVASLQWTRTGLVAFANRYSGLRAWDDRQGGPANLGTAISFVESLAFRPDGAHAAVAGSRTGTDSMYVFNVARRRPISSWTTGALGDPGVAYSPDGSRLAFQTPDGFWLFDGTLRPVRRIDTLPQYSGIERVAFSPDGRWIAAGLSGSNTALKVWPAAGPGTATTLTTDRVTYGAQPPAFTPDSKQLASFVKGKSLTLWATATWTIERSWTLAGDGNALAFAPADSRLAIAADFESGIWDAADGRKLVGFSTPGSTKTQEIAWSPDGRRVVTAADDGVLRFWRASDGQLIASLYLFESVRDWLLVTPDGRFDGSDTAVTGAIAWRVGNSVAADAALTRSHRVRGLWSALSKTIK